MKISFAVLSLLFGFYSFAQSQWQQKADYQIQVDLDVKNYQYQGNSTITYFNNSPDELKTVYFHLFYNAFQPGSAMDYRLQSIADPDGRMLLKVGDKTVSAISQLKPNEIGYQKITSISQAGKALKTKVSGTILEVELAQPIMRISSAIFNMEWIAQIPNMIRRGGRNSKEGIEFSMTQWYPKIAQYDDSGWNLDEYVGREFYVPFGNYDVSITLPSNYVIGGSGVVQNEDMMPGYTDKMIKRQEKTTWNFKAENIHDFAWAADTKFKVDKQILPDGPIVYYVYDKEMPKDFLKNWKDSQKDIAEFFPYMSQHFGKYPWPTYSIVQGGDGGMEYGTTTFITGRRGLESLRGVMFHEIAHSWFQHLFGIDETQDEWMDEGFTSYAEAAALNFILKENKLNPFQDAYDGYYALAKSGREEPMSLLADYYDTNYAYGLEAYYKGQVYLAQLGYIIGEDALNQTLIEFYNQWKFKHPKPQDLQKIAQNVSGINLKWYNNLFINTTRTIDYAIENVNGRQITLRNLSNFGMPLDVLVTFDDGSKALYYIPLLDMRGEKEVENQFYEGVKRVVLEDWAWTNPSYTFEVEKSIKQIEIDYTKRLADLNYDNNIYPRK